MTAENTSSLRRALDLLDALASDDAVADGGWGVARLADSRQRDQSQVSRTLRVLAAAGYVERDPTTLAYRIGWRVFALAARAGNQRLLTSAAPLLRRLVTDDLGERIHLTVLQGAEVLTVLTESPPHAVQAIAWAGRVVPAWNTSSGRALLLDHDLPDLERLFAGVPFRAAARNAPRDVADLYDRIVVARRDGYALVDEEFEAGLVAASAPVRDFRGTIVAALNVSAPKFRMGGDLAPAGRAVKAAAAELSRELGWPGVGDDGTAGDKRPTLLQPSGAGA